MMDNFTEIFKRTQTFRIDLWYNKPNYATPFQAALQGFQLVGENTLECTFCKIIIIGEQMKHEKNCYYSESLPFDSKIIISEHKRFYDFFYSTIEDQSQKNKAQQGFYQQNDHFICGFCALQYDLQTDEKLEHRITCEFGSKQSIIEGLFIEYQKQLSQQPNIIDKKQRLIELKVAIKKIVQDFKKITEQAEKNLQEVMKRSEKYHFQQKDRLQEEIQNFNLKKVKFN